LGLPKITRGRIRETEKGEESPNHREKITLIKNRGGSCVGKGFSVAEISPIKTRGVFERCIQLENGSQMTKQGVGCRGSPDIAIMKVRRSARVSKRFGNGVRSSNTRRTQRRKEKQIGTSALRENEELHQGHERRRAIRKYSHRRKAREREKVKGQKEQEKRKQFNRNNSRRPSLHCVEGPPSGKVLDRRTGVESPPSPDGVI